MIVQEFEAHGICTFLDKEMAPSIIVLGIRHYSALFKLSQFEQARVTRAVLDAMDDNLGVYPALRVSLGQCSHSSAGLSKIVLGRGSGGCYCG
jgi:hypothetical protein